MSTHDSRSWITFDLIENLIRRSKKDNNLKLKTFTVDDGIGKAENFCSNIVRVSVKFYHHSNCSLEQTEMFIVKSSLTVAEFDVLNEEVAYFPKEIIAYEKILPEVVKLLRSIGDKRRIAPR